MKKFISLFILTFVSSQPFAQSPGSASNPMTAPGAIGISLSGHILFWENPFNVDYNEVYFSEDSSLVANLNSSARIYNGYPSTVYNSAALNVYGSLTYNTKYFWRIVEHNSSGSTPSPVWYFKARASSVFLYENHFNSNSDGWEIFGPYGFNNWYWSNTSVAGGSPGEMVFRWDPVFIGDSYLISPEFPAAANSYMVLSFNYYEDWWSDTVVVGCAYTTDNGNNWTSIWELHATGNVGPTSFGTDMYIPGNFRLGLYYKGDSNNIDFYMIDNIDIGTPLSVALPPSLLQAEANNSELKVNLSWDPGSSPAPPAPVTGYQIQRKIGFPLDNTSYQTIANVDTLTLSFEDQNVDLNEIYTYRICTEVGSILSSYSNESTVYVPANVPVELVSFTGSVSSYEVTLNWITATEINNNGFEVQRKSNSEFESIGFIEGHGTTFEQNSYSFIDEDLQASKYFYRLKQIDFDGTSEYSNVIEVDVISLVEFSLEQNYPNPFNPTTNIKFSVPSDEKVTLKVYDILGNEIATLVNEERPAGSYEVEFSAKSGSAYGGNASGLPSGLYFYTLSAGNYLSTKKMVLLK